MTARAYLGIGSNLGDRLAYLQLAVDGLAVTEHVRVVAVSPVYETEPVGGPEQPEYLNAVVAVDTTLDPRRLLHVGQRLEGEAQRIRRERWGPRTLDVDVLVFDDQMVDDSDLVVPHPRMFERAFVIAPLTDLEPGPPLAARLPARPASGWPGVRRTGLTLVVPQDP
jgi:2-amino-4-hydroxy-6-hydroxymethyldihydropteridine diphosphokinase